MIRPLEAGDRAQWGALWDGYLDFYRGEVDAATTELTFRRLCDRSDGFFGLAGLDERAAVVGFAHCILHPSTWSSGAYCYLEDLFVAPSSRGSGVAQQLIEGVYAEADRAGAGRVYWETQEFNSPARSLYDTVAHRTSFIIYER